ncbi:CLUMA_CG010480, isoform A [Clunio marinus]|uniref:CLUMA_CG010480, isoform A n=1 Tax=Clunio marinus TaxID=568069 RepID=A0A1J1IF21_9DIPT|nr:CLUMA_CG010480, isoform A [Clunio marinus]
MSHLPFATGGLDVSVMTLGIWRFLLFLLLLFGNEWQDEEFDCNMLMKLMVVHSKLVKVMRWES